MKLNFEDIKNNASPQTFEKAQSYLDKFVHWTRQEDTLRGKVNGSEGKAYEVEVCCSDPSYLKAHCSCPAKTDFCKHATALCLTYLLNDRKPKEIHSTPEQAILAMDEHSLKEKIVSLLPEFPGLAEKLTAGLSLQPVSKLEDEKE